MGRFGPFVQIGTKDDEDKPRFAGLRPGQKMDTHHARAGAGAVQAAAQARAHRGGRGDHANVGRFGPYVKYGAKYVSLKDGRSLHDHARARARGHPRKGDRRRQSPHPGFSGRRRSRCSTAATARTSPTRQRNASIPKDRDPKSLTLEECQALLAAAPVRTFGKWGRKEGPSAKAKGEPRCRRGGRQRRRRAPQGRTAARKQPPAPKPRRPPPEARRQGIARPPPTRRRRARGQPARRPSEAKSKPQGEAQGASKESRQEEGLTAAARSWHGSRRWCRAEALP